MATVLPAADDDAGREPLEFMLASAGADVLARGDGEAARLPARVEGFPARPAPGAAPARAPVHVTAAGGPDGWLVRVPLHEQLTSNRLFTSTGGARTSTALMLARAVVARHGGTLRMAAGEHGGAIELRLPPQAQADLRS